LFYFALLYEEKERGREEERVELKAAEIDLV
jgi:hypothetical protein